MSDSDHNALEYLRKEALDIYNRLHSIEEDILFVSQVAKAYPEIALLPNLRCGAWYTDPQLVGTTPSGTCPAYFKSTDGHFGNWSFNLRRPNLQLLPLLQEKHGIILVDSTRAGKRIPDALSKTVPIWCAVVNRAIGLRYPELQWDSGLYTPPGSVSQQEHHQIEERLDAWARALAESTYPLPKLSRPLRPFWITPATCVYPEISLDSCPFFPVICLSASKKVAEGLMRQSGGFSYVQGSGDDHELWGMGLTPTVFWQNKEALMSSSRSELPKMVRRFTVTSQKAPEASHWTPVSKVAGKVILCAVSDLQQTNDSAVAYLILENEAEAEGDPEMDARILRLKAVDGKRGQNHFVQHVLPRAEEFITQTFQKGLAICIACATGNDIAVGVVLVALQKFNDDGDMFASTEVTKQSIRKRLEWVISDRPQANPSRATLKRVNEYLLSRSFRPI
ncbi:tRNA A64-2'-O-ribosylphosphate transferase [Mycena floridula]|nr:tRNA A64-2'-O-ribosylphosphate transferase [Mycena floridula]